MKPLAIGCAAIAAVLRVAPAEAGEIFGGLYVHDVKLPTDLSGHESGFDLQLGYRGGRIGRTPLQPYVFGALNTAGETSYASVGVSAKSANRSLRRLGLAIARRLGGRLPHRQDRVGSRVLFEPEVAVGAQINGVSASKRAGST